MKRRSKKLIESIKFLVNGKWVSEKEYLNIPDSEYDTIYKNRKQIIHR